MICHRCQCKIEKNQPMCTLYVRPSDGKQMTCILCAKCSIDFTQFIIQNKIQSSNK